MADVLSFSGLVINGMIAFIFPILLCYIVFVTKYRKGEKFEMDEDEEKEHEEKDEEEKEEEKDTVKAACPHVLRVIT